MLLFDSKYSGLNSKGKELIFLTILENPFFPIKSLTLGKVEVLVKSISECGNTIFRAYIGCINLVYPFLFISRKSVSSLFLFNKLIF